MRHCRQADIWATMAFSAAVAIVVLVLFFLPGCAAAPPGMRYANPNCIFRCNVVVVDATGAPMLQSLTTTQTGTGGAVSRTITDTDTITDTNTNTYPTSGYYR